VARTQAADYEQRREAIVDRAAQLFAQHGFNGSSISDLAAACQMSKSLVYHYYPSKEDILYAVMSSHIEQLVADVDQVLIQPGDPQAQLAALIHAFMLHYVGAEEKQKVLLNELDNLPAAQRTKIVAQQRTVINAVQALLIQLHPDLADDLARARVKTMLLFGMINWTHTWYDSAGNIKPGEVADMALAMVHAS
jgi:AcrR family transcriptional regulator